MKVDQNGMLWAGGDGGDSCQRMYSVFLMQKLLGQLWPLDLPAKPFENISPPARARAQLEVSPGIWVRNPDQTKWYSQPSNFSRDQMTPVICFYAASANSFRGDYYRAILWDLLKACLKRGMFAQNVHTNGIDPRVINMKKKIPDFISPDVWAIFARGWVKTRWAPIAVPVMLLGDLYSVFSSLMKCFAPIEKDGTLDFRWPGPGDVDDSNHNNIIMTQQYVCATPLSYLSRKIYKWFRPRNYGNTTLGEKSAIMGAIAWYNNGDNPEITELSRPLVERY